MALQPYPCWLWGGVRLSYSVYLHRTRLEEVTSTFLRGARRRPHLVYGLFHLTKMSLQHNPRGAQAVTVSSVFTAIAALTVLLRLYTRISLVRCAGLEDYFVTTAMVLRHAQKIRQSPANSRAALLDWLDYMHRYSYVLFCLHHCDKD